MTEREDQLSSAAWRATASRAIKSEKTDFQRTTDMVQKTNPDLQDYQTSPGKIAAMWAFVRQVLGAKE